MQNNKRSTVRTDLRAPLIVCAILGIILLAACAVLVYLVPKKQFWKFALALGGVYLVAIGSTIWAYLVRYQRITLANDAAELMTTEVSDMFRYVVDVPYAIVDTNGVVKIVSGALQDILQLRSPICNVPIANFCSVPMEDIAAYAKNGAPVKKIEISDDGVPIDHTTPMQTEIDGKQYSLKCYMMRSRGKEYYFVVFQDITELVDIRKEQYDDDPIVAYIVIDSLQELAQYIRVSYRTAVSEIETHLKEWAASFGGILREYEREKYL